MDARIRQLVRERAGRRCEYCLFPERALPYLVFHVDHIIARQHVDEAPEDPESLAWACSECNYHKGPNLVSIDPESKELAALFQPAARSLGRSFHDRAWDGCWRHADRQSHCSPSEHERTPTGPTAT